MTTARLSPAASLLRNSKLFALPRAIPGPPPSVSSEPVAFSQTATTPWPTHAAIATPLPSQVLGDWGLKRPLPAKSAGKNVASTIRVRRAIDTQEHIADFESSADHVVTLRKWQELGLHLTLPQKSSYADGEPSIDSAFKSDHDNITKHENPPTTAAPNTSSQTSSRTDSGVWPNISEEDVEQALPIRLKAALQRAKDRAAAQRAAEEARRTEEGLPPLRLPVKKHQEKKNFRWRHQGPWLAGLTGDEFENWLSHTLSSRKTAFREIVRQQMQARKKAAAKAQSLEQGKSFDEAAFESETKISEIDITNHLRQLRTQPELFGPLIASFFDLPEGPLNNERPGEWPYGRTTISSPVYATKGLPQTHPSAGLSYIRSRALAENDPEHGPLNDVSSKIGRILKSQPRWRTPGVDHSIGLAGFVGINDLPASALSRTKAGQFEAKRGGRKIPVRPIGACVNPDGFVGLKIMEDSHNYKVVGDTVMRPDKAAELEEEEEKNMALSREREPAAAREAAILGGSLPSLDDWKPVSRIKSASGSPITRASGVNRNAGPSAAGRAVVDEMDRIFGLNRGKR